MSDRRHRTKWQLLLRPIAPVLVSWAVASAMLLGFVRGSEIPTEALLLDSNAYNRVPWFIGMISNLGILAWSVGAVTAGWLAWLSRIGGRAGAHQTFRAATLLTVLLLVDDLFQVHIWASSLLGVHKAGIYLVYVALVVGWLVSNRGELRRTRWPILAAAFGAFGLSIVVDQGFSETHSLLIEDTFKLLGTVAWAQFHVLTAADISRSMLTSSSPASPSTAVFSAIPAHGRPPMDLQ